MEERGGQQPDGGVDLVIWKQRGSQHLVQCKQYRTSSVGEPKVREFFGTMAANGARCRDVQSRVCTFTEPARQFAKDKPIRLIDGNELLDLIHCANLETPAVSSYTRPAGKSRVEIAR